MKSFFISFLFVLCFHFQNSLLAQVDESGNSYYVVIGAFGYEQNAKDFIAWAKSVGVTAQYQMNTNRKLFYVYTMKDAHWGIPVQEAEKLRKMDPQLDETWVFHGTLDQSIPTETIAETPKPETSLPLTTDASVSSTPTDQPVNPVQPEPLLEVSDGKRFYFRLAGEDGSMLKAPIEVIDLDHSSLAALYPSNERISLKPINKSGRIMVQSKVFGYRLKQVALDFNNPTDSAGISLDSGTYTVSMTLKLLEQGDITIMYNVFFFKDAAIMRPDSKYEVNALVAMMQQYPTRKIVIHGHTNGNARGKIITMNAKKNFFSLTGASTGSGSATELSGERARCIEEYLITNGIDKSRMTIKAWGGKKPLFDPESERAIDNVRVEVEIAKD